MKNKIAYLLSAAMTVSAVWGVSAAEEPVLRESPAGVTVLVDGEELKADQGAVIIEGRTMAPIRAISKGLGIDVSWDAYAKAAYFTRGELKVELVIGSKTVKVTKGDETSETELDTAPVIINERTLVPLRFISENFGAEVGWDAATKTVTITSAKADETAAETEETAQPEEMAYRELKNSVNLAETYIYILKDETDGADEETQTRISNLRERIIDILKFLRAGDYTAEELREREKETEEIHKEIEEIAKSMEVELPPEGYFGVELEETTEDVVKTFYDLAKRYTDLIDGSGKKLTDWQSAEYEKYCGELEKVNAMFGTEALDEPWECGDAIETIKGTFDYFHRLLNELGLKIPEE